MVVALSESAFLRNYFLFSSFAPHLTLRADGLASSGLESNSSAGVTTWTLTTTLQNDVKLVIELMQPV